MNSLPVPQLLVPWEARWQGLRGALPVAMRRSAPPLHGELDGTPGSMPAATLSFVVHVAILLAIPAFSKHEDRLMLRTEKLESYEAVYFLAPELPAMQDRGGAQQGREGRSGGREAQHPQAIRISRGSGPKDVVVEAPRVSLPVTREAANLISLPVSPVDVVRAAPQVARQNLPTLGLQPEAVPPRSQSIARETRSFRLEVPAVEVIPPPVSTPQRSVSAPGLALPPATVVPPPVRTPRREAADIASLARADLNHVVPPRADVRHPSAAQRNVADLTFGLESARKAAPGPDSSNAALTGSAPGVVLSATPGSDVGIPGGANATEGSLAMSPAGRGSGGLGGRGDGDGIAGGPGSGSGAEGTGSGAADDGEGFGVDPDARGGISEEPGPGGADGGAGDGISIQGNVVALPSFASPGTASRPEVRVDDGPRSPPSVTIIATPRAGGAMHAYGRLKGPRVYTIYLDTRLGTAVLQFSERTPARAGYDGDLTAPDPLRMVLPEQVRRSRVVVACVIDRDGFLRNLQVLEAGTARAAAQLVSALRQWRFRPVLRNDKAIEVDAVLGIGVSTR